MRSGVLRRSFVLLLLSQSGNRGIRFGFVSILALAVIIRGTAAAMPMVRRLALCRLVLLRCGFLRRPAAVSPALLLLLRSGLAVRLCGTSGQCGLDLSADACGSLIAERIRAARRVSVYARLVLLKAGVRVVSAAVAARIASSLAACCSVCCSAAFSRRDGRLAFALA